MEPARGHGCCINKVDLLTLKIRAGWRKQMDQVYICVLLPNVKYEREQCEIWIEKGKKKPCLKEA